MPPKTDTGSNIMNKLVDKRSNVFSIVSGIWNRVKAYDVSKLFELKAYQEKISHYESKFQAMQDQIMDLNSELPKEERIDTAKAELAFTELVTSIRALFLHLEQQEMNSNNKNSSNSQSDSPILLPKINIRNFSGESAAWPEFFQLYNSLVHENNNLAPVQKFQLLKSYLRNDALAVISGFQLSSDNYFLAYETLKSRFQNPRLLATMYLNNIFHYKIPTNNSASNLKEFLNCHQVSINAIKALKINNLEDFLFFSLALRNLDSYTRKSFENQLGSSEIPAYKTLIDFVTQQLKAQEYCEQNSSKAASSNRSVSSLKNKSPNVLIANSASTSKAQSHNVQAKFKNFRCPKCHDSHPLFVCPSYTAMSRKDKFEFLRNSKRCFNCLGLHDFKDCASKKSCKVCRSNRHHTSLHPESGSRNDNSVSENVQNVNGSSSSDPRENNTPQSSISSDTFSSYHVNKKFESIGQVLLGTVQARVKAVDGSLISIRAVLDPGSQISAISLHLVKRLGLKIDPVNVSISGIGQTKAKPLGLINCRLYPKSGPNSFQVQCTVLPHITNNLPSVSLSEEILKSYEDLNLADETFHISQPIDMLLGADTYSVVFDREGRKNHSGLPIAVNTFFGWTIIGPINEACSSNKSILLTQSALSDQIQNFWTLEEISDVPILNPEDEYVENHFLSTHSRNESGRYIVSLPFKMENTSPQLFHNSNRSLKSFLSLEKRLLKNSDSYNSYTKFMSEYLELGHMSPSKVENKYVIPHHVVRKESSSSTKLRVVFNASDADLSGLSLNDRLLSGPKLQKDITIILLRFRMYPIAICADIEKMYRQILLSKNDRIFQHIFWRPSPNEPVVEFELNTVTYGVKPSAFLAIRVLRQLVHDEGSNYSNASQVVLDDVYVDDIITGAFDVGQAIELRNELQQLLHKGHFSLKKWSSNRSEVLTGLPADYIESQVSFNDDSVGIKILGLGWIPKTDSFCFSVDKFVDTPTKRSVLSYIARIFDPVGFLAPVVVSMKLLVQKMWMEKLGWDESMSTSCTDEWSKIVDSIHLLSTLTIPRCIISSSRCEVVLAGFCDASEKAYAATVYLSVSIDGCISSHLWAAKTKVAPLKTLSVPRLELASAVLLAKLVRNILHHKFPIAIAEVRLFSDSQIVLSWISTPSHQLKTFVANRVVAINDYVPDASWYHIPTKSNPADLPSRGLTPQQFIVPETHEFWMKGPEFLSTPLFNWPVSTADFNKISPLPERKTHINITTTKHEPKNPLLVLIEEFSNLNKVKRVFAYVQRFIFNCHSKFKSRLRLSGPISQDELNSALHSISLVTQNHYFPELRKKLEKHGPIEKGLRSLNPFVDALGLIRVGGRLQFSSLPQAAKHPILLPKKAALSRLICTHFHLAALHSGPNTTMSLIRQNFWILSLRGLVRANIRKCLTCTRFRGKTFLPMMAPLPAPRVNISRPFSKVGVDFAGPFSYRSNNARKPTILKAYLALFVCLVTKAVHLEVVSSLNVQAFISTLDRFISRRGLPTEIWSDNGRNFVGAARYLTEVSQFLEKNNGEIHTNLSHKSITWKFIPPYSPHFGGIWEAGVKSAKRLLNKMLCSTACTFEELSTLFARIEAVLNSRPMCPLSSDPSESADCLTPGHFLIGAPLLSTPEIIYVDEKSHLKRWEQHRRLFQQFWTKWSREYLHTLMQRGKWQNDKPSPSVGDIVFIKNLNSSPATWPIGRIDKLFPGPDGIVRVASVKTSTGQYTRSLTKLVPLDY